MKPIDINLPGYTTEISTRIKAAIDDYCMVEYDKGPRDHLGASEIGEECARRIWYRFRWAKHEIFSGRMQRLFNRGHHEEPRFIKWLEGANIKVVSIIDDEQIHVSDGSGHFGGSMDAELLLPPEYGISEKILGEFKTQATGSKFNELTEKKMKIAKPQHWAQACTYGRLRGLKFVLYLCINKNDDDLYVEFTPLDWKFGDEMIAKGQYIIQAKEPPPRIAENPAYYKCKTCVFNGIDFYNEPVQKNCRSCRHAEARPNGVWFCTKFNGAIPKEFIPNGCEHHYGIGQ